MVVSSFNKPLPGNSLTTHSIGDRPWERPPQLNTVEETLSYYMTQFSDEDVMDDMLVAIESGVPIKPLVESLYTSGTMRGTHSLDIGLLIAPALMEFFAAAAQSYDIDYKFSNRDPKKAMEQRERARITMLLESAIAKAEEEGETDEGTELLKQMADYTGSGMTREEAAETAPEEPMDEPVEEAGVPMDEPSPPIEDPTMADELQQEQGDLPLEPPQQGGGLMARG